MIEYRIKNYRNDRNMTQTELAKLFDVRRETIYNLENGKYNHSLSLAWKIAQVLTHPLRMYSQCILIPNLCTYLRRLEAVQLEIDFESTMEHIVDSICTAGYELSDSIVDK